jgi:ABC-type dipeptide/oligopeptide/nickel transport system permease component
MIMAIILMLGVFIVFLNLIVDLLYGVVDPRIRYS